LSNFIWAKKEMSEPFEFRVCCDEMTSGMSKANMDDIVRVLREALPANVHTRAASTIDDSEINTTIEI